MKRIAATALCLALAACNAPISKNPIQDITSQIAGAQVQTDLADTQSNFAQAIQVGALSANDPAPVCVNQAVAALGLGAPNPSFTPKVSGVFSFASVAYIRAQQIKALAGSGSLTVPPACLQILGQMQLDALAAAIKGLPGGGVLPVLNTSPIAVPAAAPAAAVNLSLNGN